jgi:hypothetical protein
MKRLWDCTANCVFAVNTAWTTARLSFRPSSRRGLAEVKGSSGRLGQSNLYLSVGCARNLVLVYRLRVKFDSCAQAIQFRKSGTTLSPC